MILSPRADIFTYRLPLHQPLCVRDRTVQIREGVLAKVRGEDGGVRLIEAAPLPGYSPDSMELALHQLLRHFNEPDGLGILAPAVSVRCALEMLDLPGDVPAQVLVNGLAMGDPKAATEEEVARLRACGCVKLKVGRRGVEADAAYVRTWSARLGPTIPLRLDANQAWELAAALAFWKQVKDLPIEYLEEPLTHPAQLPVFARKSGAPLALDESLQQKESLPDDVENWNLRAVILKPGALGGFGRCRSFAVAANRIGARAVVSSLFESSVGIAHLVHFAATLPGASTHHGLDTAEVFSSDLLAPALRVNAGQLMAPALNSLPDLLQNNFLHEALYV